MQLAKKFEDRIAEGQNVLNMVSHSQSSVKSVNIDKRYSKLKGVHQLQKSIVKQNMHNAMSPISAISGYLELINMSLTVTPDVDQIEYYRQKIETGIREVNSIIEQLRGIYGEEVEVAEEESEALLDVDLNWVVREVCDKMIGGNPKVEFKSNVSPLYVHTDLFISKLVIYNLINYAVKCCSKNNSVTLTTDLSNGMASISVGFSSCDRKIKEVNQIVNNASKADMAEMIENSFNEGLLTSIKLVKQIDSKISFIGLSDGSAQLKLSIPVVA